MRHLNLLRITLFALALCFVLAGAATAFVLAGAATADDAPATSDATLETAPIMEVSNKAVSNDAVSSADEALDPVDLLAILGDGGSKWLRATSSGSCYNCDTHTECNVFCGGFGACLRDLDGICDPGCPAPPCDDLKYCSCF